MHSWKAILLSLVVVAPVLADWQPPYKMHYPQLPDPNGWDVNMQGTEAENGDGDPVLSVSLADDFQCTMTTPITDIHIWYSWLGDAVGMSTIESIHAAIWSDVPDPDGTGPGYSHPGVPLWQRDFTSWVSKRWDTGVQGWYDPSVPVAIYPDHTRTFQFNLYIDPADAFFQREGQIYWLEMSVMMKPNDDGWITAFPGWKTSGSPHFNDDAVWTVPGAPWQELRDPMTQESLDLAFVITPEPGSLCLLALGALGLLRRRGR